MERTDRSFRVGGEGGEGVLSCGSLLAQAMARTGYEVYTLTVIPAEIKGGHANFTVRADVKPVYSQGEKLDALVVFNEEAFTLHKGALKPGGLLIYDPQFFIPQGEGFVLYPLQIEFMAVQELKSKKAKNIVAFGALASMCGLPFEICDRMVRQKFKRHGETVVAKNLEGLKLGFDYVRDNPPTLDLKMSPPPAKAYERLVTSGNAMLSVGALSAGVNYYAGYPITPASTVLEFMEAELPKFGGFAIQTEDEISAIASCVGASYAGAKAMTATAGPGIALMTEILGLAAMAETPLVILDVQRGGPSTGLPTKTEQSDLFAAAYGGHGDLPRIVVAPGDVEDCFYTIVDAFNLAEKYQGPVLLLSDYSLAERTQTIPRPDFQAVQVVNRLKPTADDLKLYQRYKLTPNGVSPMSIPGMPGGQYTATGLEHNETGAPHMTPATHKKMTAKRFQKLAEAAKEPGFVRRFGAPQATAGVICWGSTIGPVREAVEQAVAEGLPVAALQCRMVWPVPQEVEAFVASVPTILIPEVNYQGQFAQILRAKFLKPFVQFDKCEGLPFTANEIHQKLVELCGAPSAARSGSAN